MAATIGYLEIDEKSESLEPENLEQQEHDTEPIDRNSDPFDQAIEQVQLFDSLCQTEFSSFSLENFVKKHDTFISAYLEKINLDENVGGSGRYF